MALLQPRGPAATAAALGRSHSTATAPAPAPVGVIALPRTRSRGADHRGDRFYSPARVRRTIAKATPRSSRSGPWRPELPFVATGPVRRQRVGSLAAEEAAAELSRLPPRRPLIGWCRRAVRAPPPGRPVATTASSRA